MRGALCNGGKNVGNYKEIPMLALLSIVCNGGKKVVYSFQYLMPPHVQYNYL